MNRQIAGVDGVPRVYSDGRALMTVNASPGKTVYDERLVEADGVEYRYWDPNRSKLAALILLGGRDLGIDESTKVLYLGAASGTTALS